MSRTVTVPAASRGWLVAVGAAGLAAGCVSITARPEAPPAAPSSQPTAASISTPAPTPAPDPAGLKVPASIDATGSTDVAAQLQSFIDGAPNGSTIVFRAGGTYRLDSALRLRGKRNVTLEGNGAQLRIEGTTGRSGSSGIIVENYSENATIRNLTLVGNNQEAGTSAACCSREGQHGIAVFGSTNTLIEDVEIRRVWGDCVYVNATAPGIWADGVTFRDSTCRLTGRHGVGIIAGKHLRIERVVFDEIGFMVVDIEPGVSHEGASDVIIRDNTVGTYGLTDALVPWLLEAAGAAGSVVRDVTVTGNTVAGNRDGYSGAVLGLNIKVIGEDKVRAGFTVTDNTARSTASGPVMYFSQVDGVTVTGNVQPLSSGPLASFPGSTSVTYRP